MHIRLVQFQFTPSVGSHLYGSLPSNLPAAIFLKAATKSLQIKRLLFIKASFLLVCLHKVPKTTDHVRRNIRTRNTRLVENMMLGRDCERKVCIHKQAVMPPKAKKAPMKCIVETFDSWKLPTSVMPTVDAMPVMNEAQLRRCKLTGFKFFSRQSFTWQQRINTTNRSQRLEFTFRGVLDVFHLLGV